MRFDDVLGFAKVVSTQLGTIAKNVLLNLKGLADGDADDATAEQSSEEPIYGALGVIGRPRKPDATGHAEAVVAKRSDGLVPIALRDLRIDRARAAMAEGGVALAGYGGAFFGIDDAASGGGSILTVYVPYAFSNGVATKSHGISVDSTPGAENIIIASGEGMAITMNAADGKMVLRSKSGKAMIILDDDKIHLVASEIVARGKVLLGDPDTAAPMIPGNGFLGSDLVRVSPPAP